MYDAEAMIRVLILCTHNSVRSQIAEALLRGDSKCHHVDLDVYFAACPVCPGKTEVGHYPFDDASGGSLDRWRMVWNQLQSQFDAFARALNFGHAPLSYEDRPAMTVA